jgi:hypothetical protein
LLAGYSTDGQAGKMGSKERLDLALALSEDPGEELFVIFVSQPRTEKLEGR